MVHGPWDYRVREVVRLIEIPPNTATCQVSWRSWSIDHRDNEWDRVIIDGITVWEQQAHYSCDGWDQGPTDFPGYYISNGWICYLDVSVGVPCSGTMTVKFMSDVNQIITNEGWAFSDFSVTGTSDSGRWNGGELEILNLVDLARKNVT